MGMGSSVSIRLYIFLLPVSVRSYFVIESSSRLIFLCCCNKDFFFCFLINCFSALTLLVGWQEGHLACKN